MSIHFRWFVMSNVYAISGFETLSTRAANFYEELLNESKGKVLEIGRAKLYLAPLLVNKGFKVEGVLEGDTKEESLSVPVYKSEFPELKISKLYNAIMIPFGYLLAATDRKTIIKGLTACYEKLLPGGKIIIDLFLAEDSKDDEIKVKMVKNKLTILEPKLLEINHYDQSYTYLLSLEQWEGDKQLIHERRLQSFVWFGIKEFKLVLERVGFGTVEIFGDYQKYSDTDYLSKSRFFTITATKN